MASIQGRAVNPGDRLRCVDPTIDLTVGKIYFAEQEVFQSNDYVFVVGDNPKEGVRAFRLSRFELVLPPVQAGKYPDGNPKTAIGASKPGGMDCLPPLAIFKMGEVFQGGAAKYGKMNWREHGITLSTYTNAAMRHLLALADGQDIDPESGVEHAAHVMACMAILIDAKSVGKMVDDRGPKGRLPAYLAEKTKKVT